MLRHKGQNLYSFILFCETSGRLCVVSLLLLPWQCPPLCLVCSESTVIATNATSWSKQEVFCMFGFCLGFWPYEWNPWHYSSLQRPHYCTYWQFPQLNPFYLVYLIYFLCGCFAPSTNQTQEPGAERVRWRLGTFPLNQIFLPQYLQTCHWVTF